MNAESDSPVSGSRRARWIALGFLGAFAASVLTVLYTGLKVQGTPAEFDAGFRAETMTVGEVRTLDLVFDLAVALDDARLEVNWPAMLEPAAAPGATRTSRSVRLAPGRNVFAVEVRAKAVASAYLVARVFDGDRSLGLERVFVTVAAD